MTLCPYCLDDTCDETCDYDQRTRVTGPCAQCGDACLPGESLCPPCQRDEEAT